MATITKDVYTHSGLAPLPLTINSLYASEMGFRLSFELLDDTTNQVIYKGSLSPDSTGDMTIDLLPILKYYVKPHEFNDVGGIANASDEVFKYKYRTQESYIQSSLASDWLYVTPWANENKTVIEFDVAHHFTVADVGTYISISVSDTYPDGSVQQSLSGNWILTDIISTDRIAIALPFPGSGIGFSALVYSASQIRTTRPAVTSSTKYLYNYTLTYDEQMNCATKDNNLLSFLSTSSSVKLLSSHIYPAPRDLYSWQNEYVTILDPNGAVNKVRFTSDNCVLEKVIGVFNYKSVQISNIIDTEYTLVSGDLPLIDCNTKYYDVEFLNGANQVLNVDYLNSCNSTFWIGNYDCIDAIQSVDNVIQIDIQVPVGTTVSVPSPFTLSLDGTLYSQSVVVDDEVILYVNLNSADTGSFLETITFKNGWHMECRCICGTIATIDEVEVEFDDEWDEDIFHVFEGASVPPPVNRPWNSTNVLSDITFSVSGPYIQISLDGVNYSDTVIAPPSMTSGDLYILVNDTSQTHTDTLVITSDGMNTVTYPIQSEVILTTITLSPDTITFVDVEETQPSQKIEVTFTKNNNNAITTFTVSGNYLISNTIDGVYSSSITSNLQNGNIYVKMNDTMTPGIFTGTITATSLSGEDTASLSGEVVAMPVTYEPKVIVRCDTPGTYIGIPAVLTIGDINDVNSTQLHNISPVEIYDLVAQELLYVNNLWFAYNGFLQEPYVSTDGMTWTKITSATTEHIIGLYYIGNQYVMYISNRDFDNQYTSTDGINWTVSTIHNDTIFSSSFNDGKIILSFLDSIRISTDNGATWTSRTYPSGVYGLSYIISSGNAIFGYFNGKLYKSIDNGITWGNKTLTGGFLLNKIKLLPNGQVIALYNGKMYVTNASTSNTSWTQVTLPLGHWNNIVSNGTSLILTSPYVGLPDRINMIARTTDLRALTGWTVIKTNADYTFVDCGVYGTNYIVRTDISVMKSSDGIIWTDFTLPSGYIYNSGAVVPIATKQ